MTDIVFPDLTSGVLGRESLPYNYDLELYKGDYFSTSIVLKDSTGTVLNLTGYTSECSIRQTYNSVVAYAATCTIEEAEGRIDVLFPSSLTETIVAGDYVWDFQVTNPGGNVRTYLAGDVTVFDEVTR
jgi:hypothetical protein